VSSLPAPVAPYERTDTLMRGDLRHYCESLIKIGTKKPGEVIPFIWNAAQIELHGKLERQRDSRGLVRALILKARRLGISTYVGARYFHRTNLYRGHKAFILTHEDKATQTLFDMVRTMHDNMPADYRHSLLAANENELDFANSSGSGYRVGTAKNVSGLGRGGTLQLFHGSEAAFWAQAQKHWSGVIQAVSLVTGTEAIMESTSNGPFGAFYDQWVIAEKGLSDFIPIFLPWMIDPDNVREVPADFEPSAEEEKYQELYKLTDEQLVWAHFKNIELGGRPGEIDSEFKREYPATAAQAFESGSTNSLIADEYILAARRKKVVDQSALPRVLGVDVARSNKDEKDAKGKVLVRDATRLVDRQGRRGGVIDEEYYSDDATFLASRVSRALRDNPDIRKAYVDASEGMGAAVVSIVSANGFDDRVVGVNFGSEAQDADLYANRRCEMWGRMRDWFKDPGGAQIPDSDVAQRHLTAPKYTHDANSRLVLEPKPKIKGRTGFSPDWGDAYALTFADILPIDMPEHKPKWASDLVVDPDGGDDFMTA
jgi:hypothetical protein